MTSRGGGLPDPYNPTLRGIALEERRAILGALFTVAPLSEKRLVKYLATTGQERPSPGSEGIETLHTHLPHIHLPALEAAGLIVWNREDGTVELATHPALDDPRFKQLLRTESDGLDEALLGLSHEYRRIALTVLRDEQKPMSRTALAREILRRHGETADPDSERVEEVTIVLHHAHLPKLSEMNLVRYDFETGHATYTAYPALEDVFRIIYEPDKSVLDKYDGFLNGLRESYPQGGQDRSCHSGWPHFWREFHNG